MSCAEKEWKKFYSWIPFLHNPGKKIPKKNSNKIHKIKKQALFPPKPRWDRLRKREKNFSPKFRFYPTWARKFEKKITKKFKNFKNIIPALFLSNPEWYRPRKREKSLIPKSNPTLAWKFQKK